MHQQIPYPPQDFQYEQYEQPVYQNTGGYQDYPENEAQQANPTFNSFSIYGSQSALCFNFTERNGKKTINVDAANSFSNQKRFDWNNKISLMITDAELPYFIAVLNGWIIEFEGRFHGPQKNKSFKIINQRGKLFFSLSLAGRSVGVPIGGADAFYLLAKVMSHIIQDYPGVTVNELTFMLQTTTVRLYSTS